MTRKLAITAVLLWGIVIAVYAGDLNGRWEGKMTNPNGEEFTLIFNFKVEGDKLTGNVEGPAGELPIAEGKVTGDEFSFKVKLEEHVIDHHGKVAGDTIQMKSHGPGGDSEMTLKRTPAR